MPAAAAVADRPRKVPIQVHADGTRQVPTRIQLGRRRAGEAPPDIEHDRAIGDRPYRAAQFVDIDQRTTCVHPVILADARTRIAQATAGSRTILGNEPEDS